MMTLIASRWRAATASVKLRAGGTANAACTVKAPSTLGTFLASAGEEPRVAGPGLGRWGGTRRRTIHHRPGCELMARLRPGQHRSGRRAPRRGHGHQLHSWGGIRLPQDKGPFLHHHANRVPACAISSIPEDGGRRLEITKCRARMRTCGPLLDRFAANAAWLAVQVLTWHAASVSSKNPAAETAHTVDWSYWSMAELNQLVNNALPAKGQSTHRTMIPCEVCCRIFVIGIALSRAKIGRCLNLANTHGSRYSRQ